MGTRVWLLLGCTECTILQWAQESETVNYKEMVSRLDEYLCVIITASTSSKDSRMVHTNVSVLSLHKTPIFTLRDITAYQRWRGRMQTIYFASRMWTKMLLITEQQVLLPKALFLKSWENLSFHSFGHHRDPFFSSFIALKDNGQDVLWNGYKLLNNECF